MEFSFGLPTDGLLWGVSTGDEEEFDDVIENGDAMGGPETIKERLNEAFPDDQDDNSTILHAAAANGFYSITRNLLRGNAKEHGFQRFNDKNQLGDSALHVACRAASARCVDELLHPESPYNAVNGKNQVGRTALHECLNNSKKRGARCIRHLLRGNYFQRNYTGELQGNENNSSSNRRSKSNGGGGIVNDEIGGGGSGGSPSGAELKKKREQSAKEATSSSSSAAASSSSSSSSSSRATSGGANLSSNNNSGTAMDDGRFLPRNMVEDNDFWSDDEESDDEEEKIEEETDESMSFFVSQYGCDEDLDAEFHSYDMGYKIQREGDDGKTTGSNNSTPESTSSTSPASLDEKRSLRKNQEEGDKTKTTKQEKQPFFFPQVPRAPFTAYHEVDRYGETAFSLAVKHEFANLKKVRAILKYLPTDEDRIKAVTSLSPAGNNDSPLHSAAWRGRWEILESILSCLGRRKIPATVTAATALWKDLNANNFFETKRQHNKPSPSSPSSSPLSPSSSSQPHFFPFDRHFISLQLRKCVNALGESPLTLATMHLQAETISVLLLSGFFVHAIDKTDPSDGLTLVQRLIIKPPNPRLAMAAAAAAAASAAASTAGSTGSATTTPTPPVGGRAPIIADIFAERVRKAIEALLWPLRQRKVSKRKTKTRKDGSSSAKLAAANDRESKEDKDEEGEDGGGRKRKSRLMEEHGNKHQHHLAILETIPEEDSPSDSRRSSTKSKDKKRSKGNVAWKTADDYFQDAETLFGADINKGCAQRVPFPFI